MGRIIPFPERPDHRHGYKKARRRKRVDLEEYGQLNLFKQSPEARVISLTEEANPFESALLLEEEGDIINARKYYDKAIAKNQHVADAHCNLGILSSGEDRYAEAINHFTRALIINPRHHEAHYNLGFLYSEVKNFDLARVHYETALHIDSGFESVYYNLALLHMELEEFSLAEKRLMEFKALVTDENRTMAENLLKVIRKQLESTQYEKHKNME